jgi:hypothetical protein
MADQYNAVARGDAQHSDKAGSRSERQDASSRQCGGDTAYQSELQAEEHQKSANVDFT